MRELKEILVAYQNDERGLPTYAELVGMVEKPDRRELQAGGNHPAPQPVNHSEDVRDMVPPIETADLICRLQSSIGDAECYEWKSVSVANIRAAIAMLSVQPAEPSIDGYPLWSGLPPPVSRMLSNAEIEAIDEEVMRQPVRRGYCVRFARAILSAQASLPPNLPPNLPPITQPLIAEAARDDVMTELRKLHVGESSFEGWYAEKDMSGIGQKQLCRDAYAAGMEDPEIARLIVKRDDVGGDVE
jgi:hypothetical protein